MATSAFRSTTKRSSIPTAQDSGSSNRNSAAHRRSRSLSRPPSSSRFEPEAPPPKAKFVNTVRGSEFADISLDDLAHDFFKLSDDQRSRSTRRTTSSSLNQRRGRSVSRHLPTAVADSNLENTFIRKSVLDTGLRRRRSLSVSRYQSSDSESDDIKHPHKSSHHASVKGSDGWNYQGSSMHKPVTSNQQRVLRRSLSQRDLSKSRDGYSSQSSALTDEEPRETHPGKNGNERTIRAVYAQKKTEHPTIDGGESEFYEVMRKGLRHAVEEIRTELEHGIVKTNHHVLSSGECLQPNSSDVLQAVAVIRDNYSAKLEQSEKRKQDLLAEIVVEEQRGRELSKIVKELLPDPNNTPGKNPSRGRKKNDRSWMSKCLSEDAEKYFDDFLSNVEDTDISSFDGERSDASSSLGVKKQRDPLIHFGETEYCGRPTQSTSAPVEMDGVVLPWLQWETSNDGSPMLCNTLAEVPLTENVLHNSSQVENTAHDGSNFISSSRGSWSPGGDSPSVFSRDDLQNRFGIRGSYLSQSASRGPKNSYFDMDEYLCLQQSEETLFEEWRQRQRISSGTLILCSRTCLQF